MNFFRFLVSKAFWVQILLAVIVTVLFAFLMLKWLDHRTRHGQSVEVPNLSKLELDEVDRQLSELNLRRQLLDSANYNPDFPKYSVIEQNPLPGKRVKEGRKIYLKLNPSGYPKIEIPNMIRFTRRQVEPTLRSLGFEIGDITYKPDIAKDAVLEMWANGKKIEPGDELMKTTVIDLVLGDPDWEEKELEEATEAPNGTEEPED